MGAFQGCMQITIVYFVSGTKWKEFVGINMNKAGKIILSPQLQGSECLSSANIMN